MTSDWQKIETIPKGKWVLLAGGITDSQEKNHNEMTNADQKRIVTGRWENDYGVIAGYDSFCTINYLNPTHWMPLPDAPDEVTFEDALRANLALELLSPPPAGDEG